MTRGLEGLKTFSQALECHRPIPAMIELSSEMRTPGNDRIVIGDADAFLDIIDDQDGIRKYLRWSCCRAQEAMELLQAQEAAVSWDKYEDACIDVENALKSRESFDVFASSPKRRRLRKKTTPSPTIPSQPSHRLGNFASARGLTTKTCKILLACGLPMAFFNMLFFLQSRYIIIPVIEIVENAENAVLPPGSP